MVDRDAFDAYDSALSTNAELVKRATRMVFNFAKEMPPDQAMAYIETRLPAVASLFGKAAAQVALEAYSAQREAAHVEEPYEATYTAEVPTSYVAEDLQTAADKHRHGESWDFDAMAANMAGHMMKYPMYASDWTMTGNANRDPAHPKWAFVPHMGACPWCVMVGSRGFVYRSEDTARSQRHTNCVCPVVVDFDVDNPHLDGYDPDGMYQRMLECAEAGSGVPGSHDWGEALREARQFRDREWLRTGRIPTVGYDSPETEAKKRRDPAHVNEFNTATILASHGYKAVFWDDERHVPKANGKGMDTIGRADLDSGVEIKAMYGATSQNTFDKRVRDTRGKEDVTRLVIDVSRNPYITDEDAKAMTEQALWNRHYPEAMFIDHGKHVTRLFAKDHPERRKKR